jgi:hypothetical protein
MQIVGNGHCFDIFWIPTLGQLCCALLRETRETRETRESVF